MIGLLLAVVLWGCSSLGVLLLRRVCAVVALSLVVTVGQAGVPGGADASVAYVASGSDDGRELASTAGPHLICGPKHDLAYTYTRDGLATYTDRASGATAAYFFPGDGAQAGSGDREVTEAVYDADGFRVLRRDVSFKNGKSATASTFFLGDSEITLTGVKNTPRTVLRSFTTPGGVPVGSEENRADGAGVRWTWVLADQQRTVRLTRDGGGVKRTNYLPSGAPTGNVNLAPGARGYLGKTHDPSGDVRLDHRDYTPSVNVLTTPDPILVPYDPQSLNPYAYARNLLRVGELKLPAVPKGAVGVPTQTGRGLEYAIPRGTPEISEKVASVRIMDPVTSGKYQYPNGYAVYMNGSGQTINPLTGQTIARTDPYAHIPLP